MAFRCLVRKRQSRAAERYRELKAEKTKLTAELHAIRIVDEGELSTEKLEVTVEVQQHYQ